MGFMADQRRAARSKNSPSASPETSCHWPIRHGYVLSDARFVPCCVISNPEVMELGDALS